MPNDNQADQLRPETYTAQALGAGDPAYHGLIPAIYPSTSYLRSSDGQYPGGHTYTRDQNPGYDALEALLARLDGAADALVFASGMAAAAAFFEALPVGTRVILPREMYWTLRGWVSHLEKRGHVRVRSIQTGDLKELKTALSEEQGPTLVWVETPSNPLLRITDLAAFSEVARAHGAWLAADATLSTPALTRPLELGADYVFHSATKQLNGHGDVLAGSLACRTEDTLWPRVRHERAYRGSVLGPFEAWLLQRGLRTLHLRVRQSSQGALAVAEALCRHPQCGEVFYPGLPSHAGHEVARAQMQGGFGPMVSFRVRGGEMATRRVLDTLRVFKNATSLGSVESLVEHRARVEGPESKLPHDLLRLSIGLEHPDDLIADLSAALDAAGRLETCGR